MRKVRYYFSKTNENDNSEDFTNVDISIQNQKEQMAITVGQKLFKDLEEVRKYYNCSSAEEFFNEIRKKYGI